MIHEHQFEASKQNLKSGEASTQPELGMGMYRENNHQPIAEEELEEGEGRQEERKVMIRNEAWPDSD